MKFKINKNHLIQKTNQININNNSNNNNNNNIYENQEEIQIRDYRNEVNK